MAKHKSFTAYTPTEGATFDLNGQQFRLRPSVPGDVILDFVAGIDEENPGASAEIMRNLMKTALVPEDVDRWFTFIRDPNNNVTLNVLSDVAEYVSEVLAGNPTDKQPVPFTPG